MYALTDAYVAALAAENAHLETLATEDDAAGDNELSRFVRRREELSAAWIAIGVWPRDVSGTSGRFRMALAAEALAKGQQVFVWYGPSVETYRVVSGKLPFPKRG